MGELVPDTPAKSHRVSAHPDASAGQGKGEGRTRGSAAPLSSSREDLLRQRAPALSVEPIPAPIPLAKTWAAFNHPTSPKRLPPGCLRGITGWEVSMA